MVFDKLTLSSLVHLKRTTHAQNAVITVLQLHLPTFLRK